MKKIEIKDDAKQEIKKILGNYKGKHVSRKEDYATFTSTYHKDDAYRVAFLYNTRICPYCNINYTYTVGNGLVCRPDFDHFLNKDDYPDVAMEWDNLIPSCSQCNSRIKITKVFKRESHIHPHYDDFDSLASFVIDVIKIGHITNEHNFEIKCISSNTRASNSIRDLKINERYKYHKDVVCQIIKNGYINNRYRLSEIGTMLKMKSLSNKDDSLEKTLVIQRLLFPDIDCDISKTSLGKLKRDVSKKIRKWSSEK